MNYGSCSQMTTSCKCVIIIRKEQVKGLHIQQQVVQWQP